MFAPVFLTVVWFCSNIDRCPKSIRLCVMCIPVHIDSSADATVRYQ
jgi:hypothetical protein